MKITKIHLNYKEVKVKDYVNDKIKSVYFYQDTFNGIKLVYTKDHASVVEMKFDEHLGWRATDKRIFFVETKSSRTAKKLLEEWYISNIRN